MKNNKSYTYILNDKIKIKYNLCLLHVIIAWNNAEVESGMSILKCLNKENL